MDTIDIRLPKSIRISNSRFTRKNSRANRKHRSGYAAISLAEETLPSNTKSIFGERDIILNATEQNSMETNIHVPIKMVRAETAQAKIVTAHVLESLTSLASASGRYVPLRSSQRA